MVIIMKKTLFILLFSIPLLLSAQNKKVAIMETKSNEGVTSFQSNMVRGGLETAIANATGYEAYDRAAFDMIIREQNFQRSGAVSESQIRRLGEMAGVQYVLVTEASAEDGFFYILAKLLDVETGRFLKSSDQLCEATPLEIREACTILGDKLFGKSSAFINVANNNRIEETKTISVNGVNIVLKYVEGGTFLMGDDSGKDDEKPVHRVTLDSYYMGETEVTQSLWKAVMGREHSSKKEYWEEHYGIGDEFPVSKFDWDDVREFVLKLNAITHENFRLPTEAEWEFAARGGNKSKGYKYSGSNKAVDVIKFGKTKQSIPNELGLFDMSGNVSELCLDWYGPYDASSQTNPRGASSGSARVIRGGEWMMFYSSGMPVVHEERYRVSARDDFYIDIFRSETVGFRIVLPCK